MKKLASSAGASSRPATGAAVKPGRTASAGAVVSQATASSRARAAEKAAVAEKDEKKAREKTQEKVERRTREKTQETDEKRVKEKTQEGEEKRVKERTQPEAPEKTQVKTGEKARERTRTSSKSSSTTSATARPVPTVTMRDKTNRVHSRSNSAAAKPAEKEVQKKSRSTPDIPEVVEVVSPAEVPLPETPEIAPAPAPELSHSDLICFDTPEKEQVETPAGSEQGAEIPALVPTVNLTTSPSGVPLPSSRPASPKSLMPPQAEAHATLSPLSISIPEPHTPTPEHRPQRRAEVEQTPISALVASIQRGFLSMHGGSPLEPMIEEEESILVVDESERDGRVFGAQAEGPVLQPVQPLFSRPSVHT